MLFGTVTGRIVATIADRLGDPDVLPDVVPVTGKVRFTPSVDAAISSTEGAIILPTPIEADLDEQGYISINGVRGASLIATDSPDLNPSGFTYTVSFIDLKFDKFPLAYKSFSMALPAGTTVDLSTVTPVKTSNGATIIRGAQGDPGPSAYEAWLSLGNTGTVYDFIVSLKGEPGGGGYVKPTDGIPASDLTAGVRASLSKADSALQSAPVVSVAGRTGAVTLSKTDVGLGNVANTAPADLPVSTATGAELTPLRTGGRVSALGMPLDNIDLNTFLSNGFGSGVGMTNGPAGADGYAFVLCQAHAAGAGWASQTYTEFATTTASSSATRRTWKRQQQGGGWSPWTLVADSAGATDNALRAALTPYDRLGTVSKVLNGTDLNNWKQNGWGAGNNLTNSPDGSNAFFYVRNHANTAADNYFQQTAVKYGQGGNSGETWVRYAEGQGVYTAWVKIADIQGAVDAGARALAATKADLVGGVIPTSQIPAIAMTGRTTVANQAARLAQTTTQVQPGDVTVQSDTGVVYLLAATDPTVASNWIAISTPTSGVSSINGQTGAVTLGKTDLALGNVDNTSDVNKPVSTAQATAIALKAPLASPALTGTPTAPTATAGTNTSQVATTAYVLANATIGDAVPVTAISPGATSTALTSTGSRALRVSLTANATFTIAAGTTGVSYTQTLTLVQDATGSRTVTWPTGLKWDKGVKPTLSTAANAIDVVTLLWSGYEWVGLFGAGAVA